MKKRLRKKKRCGEFKRHGFVLVSRYPSMTDVENETLLDRVICFAEGRCLGITGALEHLYVTRLCVTGNCRPCNLRYGKQRNRGDISNADRDAMVFFVKEQGAVAAIAGPMIDINTSNDAAYEKATPTLE